MTIPLILKIFSLIGLCAALEALKHKREELAGSEYDARETAKIAVQSKSKFPFMPINSPERQQFIKEQSAPWADRLRKAQTAAVGLFAADFFYFSIDISRYAIYIKYGFPFEETVLCWAEAMIIVGNLILLFGSPALVIISWHAFANFQKETKGFLTTAVLLALGLLFVQEIGPFIIEHFAGR